MEHLLCIALFLFGGSGGGVLDLIHVIRIMVGLVLLFGENPQAVAYWAQPLCWSG